MEEGYSTSLQVAEMVRNNSSSLYQQTAAHLEEALIQITLFLPYFIAGRYCTVLYLQST